MTAATDAEFARALEARLASSLPPREFLLQLVCWLDQTLASAPPESLGYQALGRAFVAAGRVLLARAEGIAPTLAAAERYVADPTEANYGALQVAATSTYPFGPGDGCLGVAETGYAGCEPGSGCRTGAGSLASVAEEVGYEPVAQAIRAELGAWLGGRSRA